MKTLVFLLEERSAEAMLKVLLPKILPKNVHYRSIVFEGKQDLEKNIEPKIRGWTLPNSCFIVMRDQDSGDCHLLKRNLVKKCEKAARVDSLVRIACHELESFYLGDLAAVAAAYGIKTPSQASRKYRNPDVLANAADELARITNKEYQKIDGSRRIANFLKLDGTNTSTSFNILLAGIRKMAIALKD